MRTEENGITSDGDSSEFSSDAADSCLAADIAGGALTMWGSMDTESGMVFEDKIAALRAAHKASFLDGLSVHYSEEITAEMPTRQFDEDERSALQARRALKRVKQLIVNSEPGSVYFPELTEYDVVTEELFRAGVSDVIERTVGKPEVRHYSPELVDEAALRVAEWSAVGLVVRSHVQVTPDHTVIGSYYDILPRPQ